MTYNQARLRIGVYFLLAWVLLLATLSIVFMAVAKAVYFLVKDCSLFVCGPIQNGIAYAVNNVFFLGWLWEWLPEVPPDLWYLALFNSIGLSAIFFFPFSLFLQRKRRDLAAALREALARARVEAFRPKSTTSQSVGPIQAGGNVTVEQTINNNPEIRDWDKSFSKSPLGQIVIAAAGGFLAWLAGKLMGG
jgi:hypothetical protein